MRQHTAMEADQNHIRRTWCCAPFIVSRDLEKKVGQTYLACIAWRPLAAALDRPCLRELHVTWQRTIDRIKLPGRSAPGDPAPATRKSGPSERSGDRWSEQRDKRPPALASADERPEAQRGKRPSGPTP
jgi:hypothetical protein